jgi:hypothetical protein
MSLVRPGRSSIFVTLRFHLKNFGQIGWAEKHVKILADRALHREIKQILDTDRPYSAPAGLREPKPEPVDEEPLLPHEFMYRCKGIFDESSS